MASKQLKRLRKLEGDMALMGEKYRSHCERMKSYERLMLENNNELEVARDFLRKHKVSC